MSRIPVRDNYRQVTDFFNDYADTSRYFEILTQTVCAVTVRIPHCPIPKVTFILILLGWYSVSLSAGIFELRSLAQNSCLHSALFGTRSIQQPVNSSLLSFWSQGYLSICLVIIPSLPALIQFVWLMFGHAMLRFASTDYWKQNCRFYRLVSGFFKVQVTEPDVMSRSANV